MSRPREPGKLRVGSVLRRPGRVKAKGAWRSGRRERRLGRFRDPTKDLVIDLAFDQVEVSRLPSDTLLIGREIQVSGGAFVAAERTVDGNEAIADKTPCKGPG